jgi:hypothetical protein
MFIRPRQVNDDAGAMEGALKEMQNGGSSLRDAKRKSWLHIQVYSLS